MLADIILKIEGNIWYEVGLPNLSTSILSLSNPPPPPPPPPPKEGLVEREGLPQLRRTTLPMWPAVDS